MPSLMERGLNLAAARLQTAAGGGIVYQFQQYTLTLSAAFGRTEYQIDNGHDVKLLHTDRDFLVSRSDLTVGGAEIEPQPGHRITDAATGEVFEAMPLGSDPCYRPCDPFGTMIRIHTKKVSQP